MRRCASLSAISNQESKALLVGQLLQKLAESLPQQLKEVDGEYIPFSMRMPDNPLTVLTVVVEYSDGRLLPVIDD